MADTFKGIITADGKKRQLPYSAVWETPVSDETLSIQGAFADAKVVGDKFKEAKTETDSLKEDIYEVEKKEISPIFVDNYYVWATSGSPNQGKFYYDESWTRTDYTECKGAEKLTITVEKMASSSPRGLVFYDADKNVIVGYGINDGGANAFEEIVIDVPHNASYFVTCFEITLKELFSATLTYKISALDYAKKEVERATKEEFAIKEDLTSKADKTSLAQTDRKLDALWKLNQGISYEFQTDEAEAYQKTVPSGAKVANVEKIGGRTLVWNQLVKHIENSAINNVSINTDEKGTFTLNGTSSAVIYLKLNDEKESIIGHKYYISQKRYPVNSDAYIYNDGGGITLASAKSAIQTATLEKNFYLRCDSDTTFDNVVLKPIIFDLTQMFGSGNEPSTPEEFEAMFPADYYPYNAGELMSAPVNEVTEQGKNLLGGKAFADKIVELGGTLDEVNGKVSIAASVVSDKTVFEFPDESKSYTIILSGENTNTNLQSTNLRTDKGACNMFVDRCSITTVTGAKKIFGTYDTQIAIYDYEKCGIFEGVLTADDFKPYHKTSYPIPQAILNLPGYGWSAGDVRNEVNWENKKYHKRVGKYTIDGSEDIYKEESYWVMTVTDFEKPGPSTKNAICVNFKMGNDYLGKWGDVNFRRESNGFVFSDSESKFANSNEVKDYFRQNNETIYYELNEEQIIDISDIIDNTFQEPIEVEAGGTLTFKNSHGDDYRIPIPSSEEYVISLAEVAK